MQRKIVVNNKADDLQNMAVVPIKDLNNLLKQVDIIQKMSQSVVDQFNALGIDGFTFNIKVVTLKDYHINDKDQFNLQSNSNE